MIKAQTPKPEITVVVPCYNVENSVQRCLQSIVAFNTIANKMVAYPRLAIMASKKLRVNISVLSIPMTT